LDNTRQTTTETSDTSDETPKRGRGCGCWIALILFLLAGGGASAFLGATFALRQEVPLEPEAAIADLGKRVVAVPGEFQDWRMPASAKEPASVNAGRDLFATECGLCHGQDGRKPTSLGLTMFPPAVDLSRQRTQTKSDGQLYWLIWHGLNYTGMPAWGEDNGGPNNQAEIWSMVAYIRTLK
jgi:mono/diheme cytochrome c family protein